MRKTIYRMGIIYKKIKMQISIKMKKEIFNKFKLRKIIFKYKKLTQTNNLIELKMNIQNKEIDRILSKYFTRIILNMFDSFII